MVVTLWIAPRHVVGIRYQQVNSDTLYGWVEVHLVYRQWQNR